MRSMRHVRTLAFLSAVSISILLSKEAVSGVIQAGLIERIRYEYYNNTTDFDYHKSDQNGYFRIRTSAWGQLNVQSRAALYLKLTNEFRKYTFDPKDRDFTWDEIFFDNLYLRLMIPGQWGSLTVGRQNLMYGEGFILMDGTPWDGSRSIYYDALKLSLTRGKTAVDLLAVDNTRIEDRLPVIRGSKLSDGELKGQPKDQPLNDGAEKAFGLYITSTALPKSKIEAYYIRKTEKPEPWYPRVQTADELSLNTIGFRLNHSLTGALSLTTEWAYQKGTQGAMDHKAFGGYLYGTYQIDAAGKSAFSAGLYCLSGDDPATADNEGWNPLFSRWPKWSELYIYSHMSEINRGAARVAYWTNILAPYLSYSTQPVPKLTLIANLYLLRAFEERTFADGSPSGKGRGTEVQSWIKYAFNKKVSGHLLFDWLIPGNFYPKPRTSGPFMRGEILINI
ncbi:alginate export family protein [bacterium]|nr:alginate export family protein [bacterium]